MSDKSKQPFDKLKKGFSNMLKGRKPSAFTGKANVLGSTSNSQNATSGYRPPYNPRSQPEPPKPKTKTTPTPNSTPTPTQPWSLEDVKKDDQKNDELAPMTEFNPYQAAAISSNVIQVAANVPQQQQQNVPQQQQNVPWQEQTSQYGISQGHTEASQQLPNEEFENDYVEHEEVGYDSEALELSLAMISSHQNQFDTFEVLGKLFRNIVGNPTEQKYRRLRLSNKKIADNIVNVSGGLELLQNVNFLVLEENGDQFAVLSVGEDLAGIQAALSYIENQTKNNNTTNSESNSNSKQTSSNSVQSLQKQDENSNQTLNQKRDRNTKIFLPVAPDTDVPDWFFERTNADIKQEYLSAKKRREQGLMLMTKEMRAKLNLVQPQNNQQKSFAQIRVRFPQGVVLQGEFGLNEQCMNIYIWVEECLQVNGQTFSLILPNRENLEQSWSVQKADLAPQTLMNLNWSGQSAIDMKNVTGLKEELLKQAKLSAQM